KLKRIIISPFCLHFVKEKSPKNRYLCSMIKMQYPEQKPRMKTENGKDFVFCVVRKKWLVLTPEEWVRQNFILALTQLYHYPLSLVAVEKRIQIHELTKRFDIVVYDRNIQP